MKFLFLILSFIAVVSLTKAGGLVTESMKRGIKKIGESCQRSVGATMEEMNSIRYGPPYKGKTACAVACILEKAGVMSNKKYSKRGFLTAVTPFLLADPKKMGKMRDIANNCEKEVANSEDECEAADHVIQCLRKNIPQITDFEF